MYGLARQSLREAKTAISKGIDPAGQKRTMRISRSDKGNFKVIARSWSVDVEREVDGPLASANSRKDLIVFPMQRYP